MWYHRCPKKGYVEWSGLVKSSMKSVQGLNLAHLYFAIAFFTCISYGCRIFRFDDFQRHRLSAV